MSQLGFFIDIAGTSAMLEDAAGEERVAALIYALGNELHKVGEHFSEQHLARFHIYQLGDGFAVHFDNVKFDDHNCQGNEVDMLQAAIVLAQRLLIEHNGIVHVGIASGSFSGWSLSGFHFANNGANPHPCGKGCVFLLPVMGALISRANALTKKSCEARLYGFKYEPRVVVHSNLGKLVQRAACSTIDNQKDWLVRLDHFIEEVAPLYQTIWQTPLNKEIFLESLAKYNDTTH